MEKENVAERPRRRAARIIRQVEDRGGFPLACGCVLAAKANEIRRLMELTGPETVLEIAASLECERCPRVG